MSDLDRIITDAAAMRRRLSYSDAVMLATEVRRLHAELDQAIEGWKQAVDQVEQLLDVAEAALPFANAEYRAMSEVPLMQASFQPGQAARLRKVLSRLSPPPKCRCHEPGYDDSGGMAGHDIGCQSGDPS